ncbi:MAG: MFS transporter, partial [Chloroflexota bacterium]
ILEHLSWHWIFMVNVPIGIIGIFLVTRYVTSTTPVGGQQFDIAGAVTLSVALLALLLGMTNGQTEGFTSPLTLGLFAVAIISTVAFVAIELRHPQPMIEPSLFRNRLFTVNLVTGLIIFIGIGSSVLIPFYLENVLGYGAQQVGLLLAVMPVALGITAPISGTLSDRFGARPITVAGLAVTAVGYLTLATLKTDTTAVGFMLRYLPVGIGLGLFQSPNNSAIMGSVPSDRLGIASSLLATTRSLGQTVGIAVLGALWAVLVFRVAGESVPGGATAASVEAQVAGFQITNLIVAILTFGALILAVWTWTRERRDHKLGVTPVSPSVMATERIPFE